MVKIYVLLFSLVIIASCGDGSSTSSDTSSEEYLSISYITPKNNAVDVVRESIIIIEFDASLDPNSVQNNFTIEDQNDNIIEISEIEVVNNRIFIQPVIKLSQKTTYKITLLKQINSIDGTSLSEDYTSFFTTKSAEWSTPTQFIENGGYTCAAINNLGDIITTNWSHNDNTNKYEILMNERTQGVWSNGEVISDAMQVYSPRIVMDNNGNAIVSWDKTFQNEIVVKELRNGSWGTPWIINSSDVGYSVSMNDNGYAVITWSDNSDIYITEYINQQWGQPTIITSNNSSAPRVKINNNGDGIIVWEDYNFSEDSYKLYSCLLSDGTWGEPQAISNEVINIIRYYISFDLDEEGNVIIVWSERGGTAIDVAFKNEYKKGEWTGPEMLNPSVRRSFKPKVAMSDNGCSIMLWKEHTYESGFKLVRREYKNGIWLESDTISTNRTSNLFANVKMDKKGDAIIVWNHDIDNGSELFISHLFNKQWTDHQLISVSDNQLNPINFSFDMNDSGDIVLVWNHSEDNVWKQSRSIFQ